MKRNHNVKHQLSPLCAHVARQFMKLRQAKMLTYREVGQLTGLSDSTLSLIENGEGNPKLRNLEQIARGLDVDVSYFFAGFGIFNGGSPYDSETIKRKVPVSVQEEGQRQA